MAKTPATITVKLNDWKKVHDRVSEMQQRYEQAAKNQIDVINRLLARLQASEKDAAGAKHAIAIIMKRMAEQEVTISMAEMVEITNEAHIETEFDNVTSQLTIRLKEGPEPLEVPETNNTEEEKQDV